MKHYEMLYILPATVPETQLDPIQADINGLVTAVGGTLTRSDFWGRKKLAYPIKGERNGFYILAEFDLDPAKLKELEGKLKLASSILRYMLLQKQVMTVQQAEDEAVAQKRMAARVARRPQTSEGTRTAPVPSEPAPMKEEPKIKLEELDKKLDEILDQDIMK